MNDDEAIVSITIDSPVGLLEIVGSSAGVRAVLMHGEKPDRVRAAGGARRLSSAEVGEAPSPLLAAAEQLALYFEGTRMNFDVALDPVGTPFQLEAWEALRTIPYGKTVSYGEQARRIGRPSAVRAIGAANGRNPIGIIVPCHRVIGSGGSLTGYAGGLHNKRWLLDHEIRHSLFVA